MSRRFRLKKVWVKEEIIISFIRSHYYYYYYSLKIIKFSGKTDFKIHICYHSIYEKRPIFAMNLFFLNFY